MHHDRRRETLKQRDKGMHSAIASLDSANGLVVFLLALLLLAATESGRAGC